MASPERSLYDSAAVHLNHTRHHIGAMPFHVLHKVPAGDSLYVRAKHVQLVDRDPEKAIALFYGAIEAGDRVDSALKDMAIVLKQQNRCEEAILAISCYRSRCSQQSQASLDNVLLDLYKSCGRLDDQIALLIQKLQLFQSGQAFNGKRTKTARSQGRKFQVSVEQEASRLLGNLGWAYMQQANYISAESVYRKAMALEVDNNKICNLGVCLMKQGRFEEAISILEGVSYTNKRRGSMESHLKSYQRAQELIMEARNRSRMSRHSLSDPLKDDHCVVMDPETVAEEMEASPPRTYNHKDAQNMSNMVAAAWMFACSNGSSQGGGNGGHGNNENRMADGSGWFSNGEDECRRWNQFHLSSLAGSTEGPNSSSSIHYPSDSSYCHGAGYSIGANDERSDRYFHAYNAGLGVRTSSDDASVLTSYGKPQVLEIKPIVGSRRLPVFQDLTIPGSAA